MSLEQFKEQLKEGKVLVDFYAPWCGPCNMMMPTLDALEEEGHRIIKVDVDAFPDIQQHYGIMSVPTFVVFENGNSTKLVTGFVPKELLEDMLE